MYIINIAFITERHNEATLLEWLDKELPKIIQVIDARFIEVAGIENDPDFAKQALNISLQFDIDSFREAQGWLEKNMPAIRGHLIEIFGEGVMVFATILRKR